MATSALKKFEDILNALQLAPRHEMWSSYDPEADTLYIHFIKDAEAEDSELGDDDVISRYRGDALIGLTVLHASSR